VGISKIARIGSTVDAATAELPEEFWDELELLVPAVGNWMDASRL
jgi:D-threo-aldose 1-dehydrogenase